MRKVLIVIIFGISVSGLAQRNAIYAEVMGNGGEASLNYERQLTNNPIILFRIGVGLTRDNVVVGKEVFLVSLPTSIHYLIDLKKNNYLDFSVGVSWFDTTKYGPSEGVLQLFTGIGFRRNFGKNWFFRGHISPYVETITKSKIIEMESTSGQYGGFGGFYYPYSPKFYGYGHKDAWLGFSIGKRF